MRRRALTGVAVVVLLFAVFLAVLFPTDAILRRVLAQPGWPPLTFGPTPAW